MKKFVSILLVLVLMMSFSAAAFADDAPATPAPTPASSVTITKAYVATNGSTAPATDFQFTLAPVDGAPMGTVSGTYRLHFDQQGNASFNIDFTQFGFQRVGTYQYTITETQGNVVGISYDEIPVTLTVFVTQDPSVENSFKPIYYFNLAKNGVKQDSTQAAFTNTFNASSTGDGEGFTVSKTVEGNMGDKNADFGFTVVFTAANNTVDWNHVTVKGATNSVNTVISQDNKSATYTFTLKHGQAINFGNVPYEVLYAVEEGTAAGYTTTVNGTAANETSDKINAPTQTVAFKNVKNATIPGGVSMDSLPYILMLVVVGAAVVVIATRKKGEQF